MRNMLIGLLTFIIIIALSACGATNESDDTAKDSSSESNKRVELTIGGNGGKIESIIRDEVAPKFKEKTGITINYVPGVSTELAAQLEIQKNAPQIDLVLLDPYGGQIAKDKGLIEQIDENTIPKMKEIDSRFIGMDKAGIPILGQITAPAYNTETFEKNGWDPIESWNDLVNPEFEGKTAYLDISNGWGYDTFYALATANGGGVDNLEPGLEKAKELAGYSNTFYKNSTQVIPTLQQGAADVTVLGSYVIADLAVDSGLPLKMVIPEEGASLQSYSAVLVKNAPHKEEALEFINFLLEEEAQKSVADAAFYPVLKGMGMPEKYEEVIGFDESDKTYPANTDVLVGVREEWTDRWSKEVIPELGKLLK